MAREDMARAYRRNVAPGQNHGTEIEDSLKKYQRSGAFSSPPAARTDNHVATLFAVVVRIAGTLVTGALQSNCVLWEVVALWSLCCRLRRAGSLLWKFVGGVSIAAANWVYHMREIGVVRGGL
jgi:hypothetical protein